MSQPIAILGTRSLAEKLADYISEIPGYEVAAYVENMNRTRCGETIDGLPIIWVDEIAGLRETHIAICGLATIHRWRYIEQVQSLGMRFATIVHPRSLVSIRAELGEGCFISPMASVATRTTLGRHVFVNTCATIGHHSTISNYVTIQPGATIAGLTTIGERTYIGMGAVIIDKVGIGSGCVVGAGAVVTQDVPDNVLVVGVPARVTRVDIEGK